MVDGKRASTEALLLETTVFSKNTIRNLRNGYHRKHTISIKQPISLQG